MAHTDNRSLQEIKRETEQTRAGLTNTVEELRTSVAETAHDIRERISPAAIKAEVSQYIRSRGEQLLDDVTTAARKNPMQAVAVGASVAYPLLRIARAIPLPLLMLGAGVFLAGSKTGKAYTQKASDVAADLADQATRRAHDLGDQIGELGEQIGESVSAVKSYSSEKLDRLGRAVSGGTEQVSRAAGAAGSTLAAESQELQGSAASIAATMADRAAGVKDQGMRLAGSAADTVKGLATNAASAGRQFADSTREAGMDAARAVRDTASDLTDRAGKTIFQTIEQNPLLVAGVGLVVGGLIASALPRSDLEDEVVGGTSNAVKRYASSAAAQGLDVARNAVGEIYDEATRQAEAEGLSPDALDRTARDVGQKLRRVAETAVTTAFEPAQENHQDHQSSGPQGENNHG